MIGIVVVSHSNKVAEELINLSKIFMQEDFKIENGGNPEKETYGSNIKSVKNAIEKANDGDGVLVFVDMGSSVFNAQEAIKELKKENSNIRVEIADAPLVEGLISAVVANFDDMTVGELKEVAEDSKNFKKIKK